MPSIEQYEHSIQFSVLLSRGTSYYSVVVPNDAYFKQELIDQQCFHNASDDFVYGYGYSTSFSSINTVAHTNPNGNLFVSIYG